MMSRLFGFTATEVVRKLRRAVFVFDRQAIPELGLPCLTIQVTWLQERCAPSYGMQA